MPKKKSRIAKPFAPPATNSSLVKKLVVLLLGWQVWVVLVAWLATLWLPQLLAYSGLINYGRKIPYLLSVWGNFDGYYYSHVAATGYVRDELPFFPLFPFAIRFVNSIGNPGRIISGVIVSHLALIGSLVIMTKLLKLDLKKVPFLFFAILLAFPTSHYYGAVYNDAPFLFFACLTMLWGRRGKWILASLAGVLATLTRLNGLALAVYLTAEYIWGDASLKVGWKVMQQELIAKLQTMWRERQWQWLAIGLIPVVFLAYLYYIQVNFGDWHYLFSAMKVWHQDQVTFPPVVVWRYLRIFVENAPTTLTYWIAVLEFLSVVFYCAMLFFTYQRIRFSYWLFLLLSVLIPWLTGTFQGMPRYGLHLYPLFVGLYLLLEKQPKWIKIGYFAVCLVLQFFLLSLYTRGYFVT